MGKLVFNSELCTGCRACELACSFKHERLFSPHLARIRVVRVDEEGIDVPTGCEQCEVAACIAVCPVRAIYVDPETDGVIIDYDRCIGCKECMTACPFGAVHYNRAKGIFYKCDLCGGDPECVKWCVTGGVQYITDLDTVLQLKRTKTAERALRSIAEGASAAGAAAKGGGV
ncbi:MAG: 4Fe-4S dicluster domain-containing protein [Thermoplasmata archaeon]|nr:MAG: 4Fe-4S dicluster domain-containing protein [Thermoplasmata archaeon]